MPHRRRGAGWTRNWRDIVVNEPLRRGRPAALKTVDKFEVWQQREAGVSIRDCAAFHNVSRATIMRVMAEMRKRLGRVEKLPNEQRARSYLQRREIQSQTT